MLTNASTTVNILGQVANAFLQTAGTVNVGEITQANNDGMLIEITGGSFTSSEILLGRDNNYAGPTATTPTAALTTVGLYINSTNTLSPAQVYLGQLSVGGAAGANSSTSLRMDAGSMTVTNEVLVGSQGTTGRWTILQINGGYFTNLDTVNGLVIANSAAAANDAEVVFSGGSNYVQLINFGTSGDTATGDGFMFITNSTLYVGGGGINLASLTATYVPTISLESGLIGALADWSSTITSNGGGSGWRLPLATTFTIQAGRIPPVWRITSR